MTDHNDRRPRRVTRSTGILLTVGAIAVAVVGFVVATRASGPGPTTTVRALGTASRGTMVTTTTTSVTASAPAVAGSHLPWRTSCQAPLPPGEQSLGNVSAPDLKLSWLPAGATAQYSHDCRFPRATYVQVDLPGRANADTVPVTGIPAGVPLPAVGTPYHPASVISVVAIAKGVPSRPLPNSTDPPYTTVTTSVNGHPGTMSYPGNGLGGYHIGWMQGGDYVQVSTTRGLTPDGISGVPLSQLEQVAEGVRLS